MANINGGPPNDRLIGTPSADRINGFAGNDIIYGRAGNDIIYGGTGNDKINSEAGNDVISGGSGNDGIFGADGNDYLRGDEGNDRLSGGNGNDFLTGRAGTNNLFGGAGADTFAFYLTVNEVSRIHDFNISEGDRVLYYANTGDTTPIFTDQPPFRQFTITVDNGTTSGRTFSSITSFEESDFDQGEEISIDLTNSTEVTLGLGSSTTLDTTQVFDLTGSLNLIDSTGLTTTPSSDIF